MQIPERRGRVRGQAEGAEQRVILAEVPGGRFGRREELAMRELPRMVPQVPRLIEAGPRSVIYPFYDDVLRYQRSSGWLMRFGFMVVP